MSVAAFGRTAITAVLLFVVTNVDSLAVLTMIFLAARASAVPRRRIVIGHYLGFLLVVAASCVAAAGLANLAGSWIGLLGLAPLVIGVRDLWAAVSHHTRQTKPVARNFGAAAAAIAVIATGGDNVAVYTATFHEIGFDRTIVMVVVFLVMVGVWCVVAALLGGHQRVAEMIGRAANFVVPVLLILIGVVLLVTFWLPVT